MSTFSWSQVLERRTEGTLATIAHTASWVLDRRGWWCAGQKGVGHSALPGAAASSLGIFHPGSRGPARSERALSPAWFLARFRRSSPRRARSLPHPPLPWPRPPPSQWRRPASAATAALSSRGCRGQARKPCARSGRRIARTQVSAAGSEAHPAPSRTARGSVGAGGVCLELQGA